MTNKIDVIIPTWNSMPELGVCLDSLVDAIPKGVLGEIIVVDKDSTDGTQGCAVEHDCTLLFEPGTLGRARKRGLLYSSTDWICFVDSDIKLPAGWYNKMYEFMGNNTGWIYGRTIDDCHPLDKEKQYKMEVDLKGSVRYLKLGERAYTHNSICLRKPLISADISKLNSWEDYVLCQQTMKAGLDVIEVPVTCTHLRSSTYEKFGDLTEAWSIAGEVVVKGLTLKVVLRPFWFLYWGVRCGCHFRDVSHITFNTIVFLKQIRALLDSKQFFCWERG